jgi:hypothetical protein
LSALPASAVANPSFTLQQAAEGVSGKLPSKVTHQLAITAGATAETVRIQTLGKPTISGAARYRTATKAYADDASPCGTMVGVAERR